MSEHLTRAKLCTGLVPNQWVIVLQKEEPVPSPVYNSHAIGLHFFTDLGYNPATVAVNDNDAATSTVSILIQDSNDGVTWTTRWDNKDEPIVPGGSVQMTYYHAGKYVRVVAYSTGRGCLRTEVLAAEEQSTTALFAEPLSCASFCEVDCETGTETAS